MFILFGKENCGENQYVIGVSEDKAKLQSMIDQYDDATISSSGMNLAFEDCQNEFAFGDFVLKKAGNANFVSTNFASDGICIYWDDYLFIEEAKNL
jgi:hypothetical protein